MYRERGTHTCISSSLSSSSPSAAGRGGSEPGSCSPCGYLHVYAYMCVYVYIYIYV